MWATDLYSKETITEIIILLFQLEMGKGLCSPRF